MPGASIDAKKTLPSSLRELTWKVPHEMSRKFKDIVYRIADYVIAAVTFAFVPALFVMKRKMPTLPVTQRVLDKAGVAVIAHHYYSPAVFPSDITDPLGTPRLLPGLNLTPEKQLALVREFHYSEELLRIPVERTDISNVLEYAYHNGAFEYGDGEMLYNIIRHFKPKKVIEVGCGQSTLVALLAERRNSEIDPSYRCSHICIEPFEHPWLENTGVEVIREKLESVDRSLVGSLEAGDILFIDSSHVIRPQGDVLHEILVLLPSLQSGVLVHFHDIFTPRNYPEAWVLGRRLLFNEQYLLEAFLCFNGEFEILVALNYLSREHCDALSEACPVLTRLLARGPWLGPGSFWLRKR